MIPKIKCSQHGQDLKLIDLERSTTRQSRVFCLECLEANNLAQPYQIKKLPNLVDEFLKNVIQEINDEYNPQIEKLRRLIKTLYTQKEKMIEVYDDLIRQSEKISDNYCITMKEEIEYFENLMNDLSKTKLEDIASFLSGSKQRKSKVQEIKDIITAFDAQVQDSLNLSIEYQFSYIKDYHILITGQLEKKNQTITQYPYYCYTLITNQYIYGGIGDNIVILEQNNFQLQEQSVLKRKLGYFSKLKHSQTCALAIYKCGNILVSGRHDSKIKLWIKNGVFECVQTYNDHKGGITSLQLTQDDNYLISTSRDWSIKIWMLRKDKLECIQTLNEHSNSVFFVSLAHDLMATSSGEKYVNIFEHVDQGKIKWKKVTKINGEGNINRIHFHEGKLICQQVNPPKFIIFQSELGQYIKVQEIELGQPDNDYVQFPMFCFGNSIICKNEDYIYIIKRTNSGYYIEQTIQGSFSSGCVDISGQNIILANMKNFEIEIYGYY